MDWCRGYRPTAASQNGYHDNTAPTKLHRQIESVKKASKQLNPVSLYCLGSRQILIISAPYNKSERNSPIQ